MTRAQTPLQDYGWLIITRIFLLSDECQLFTSRKLFTHVMYRNKGETGNLESNQRAGEMIQNQEYLKGAFIFLRPRLIASGTRIQTPDGVT